MLFYILIIIIICTIFGSFLSYKIYHEKYINNKTIFNTYLINLKQNTDRLEYFKNTYSSDLPKYILIDAVNGKDIYNIQSLLSDKAVDEFKFLLKTGRRKFHYQLTYGAVGCYLSHVNTWKKISESDKDIGIIFEDDCLLPPNLLFIINDTLLNCPDDWDIILLGPLNITYEKYNDNFDKISKFILLHSYIINKKAIYKINNSNLIKPITQQIDHFLSELAYNNLLNIYKNNKVHIVQKYYKTDIQTDIDVNYNPNTRYYLI
jgi:GR25 family glycosyltransferase involved in LPS biosynthesis